jgi:hypothetical protein
MKIRMIYCTDGRSQTATAVQLSKKWTIFGICNYYKFKAPGYKKILFDTTFDDIMPFNSTSGVSYVAVNKGGLWGLIRFRQNPKFAYEKKNYQEALESEPIDEKAMDILGREIKMIEDIKYTDINIFKEKYHLGNPDLSYEDITDNEQIKKYRELRAWSDSSIEKTKDALSTLEFGCTSDGKVRMKRSDGSYGFIPLDDALTHKYNVHDDEDDTVEQYNNVSEMIEDGWVLD